MSISTSASASQRQSGQIGQPLRFGHILPSKRPTLSGQTSSVLSQLSRLTGRSSVQSARSRSSLSAPGPVSVVSPRTPVPVSALSMGVNPVRLNAAMSEAQVRATGAPSVRLGSQTLYIGFRQTTSINQDPIVMAFEGGRLRWSRSDYETTGADGRGYGLFANGTNLYGVFSVDGTQGISAQDFRRAAAGATQSWLRSYGSGGGAKIAVVAQLNPSNGAMTSAAHLSSVLSSGRSNSFQVRAIRASDNSLWIDGNAWFSPRNVNGSAMTRPTGATAGSPFSYSIELSPDLRTARRATAVGWTSRS